MKINLKKSTASILFELLTVTLGVFIALAINSWYESYQNKQKSYELLKRIEQELNLNQPKIAELEAHILKSITHVESLSDTLELALEKPQDNTEVEVEAFDFFYQVLNFDVWQLSQNRVETNELPVDLIANIGKAYRYAQALSESNRQYIRISTDLLHQYEHNTDTLSAKLASNELMENKLGAFKVDIVLAKITNEDALKAIYEYAPDIKRKREALNALEEREKPADTLLSETNVNPEQAAETTALPSPKTQG